MARPKKEIDWKIVDELLEADCEGTEIAAYLGMCPDTLYDRCKLEHKTNFSEYLQQKKAKGNSLLKKTQFDAATVDKDRGMLIWLGKQRLGQKDKNEHDHTTKGESLKEDVDLSKLTLEEKIQFGKLRLKTKGLDD